MKRQHRRARRMVGPNLLADVVWEALDAAELGVREAARSVRGSGGETVTPATISRLRAGGRRRVDGKAHLHADLDLPEAERAPALERDRAKQVGFSPMEELSPRDYNWLTTGLLPRVPNPVRREELRRDLGAALLVARVDLPALRQQIEGDLPAPRQQVEGVIESRPRNFWQQEALRQKQGLERLAESLAADLGAGTGGDADPDRDWRAFHDALDASLVPALSAPGAVTKPADCQDGSADGQQPRPGNRVERSERRVREVQAEAQASTAQRYRCSCGGISVGAPYHAGHEPAAPAPARTAAKRPGVSPVRPSIAAPGADLAN